MVWWSSSARPSNSPTRRSSSRWLNQAQWTDRRWLQLASELAVFERWLMADDKHIRDDESDRDRTEQDDPTTTRRMTRVMKHRLRLLAESCNRYGDESRKIEAGQSGSRSIPEAKTTWIGAKHYWCLARQSCSSA